MYGSEIAYNSMARIISIGSTPNVKEQLYPSSLWIFMTSAIFCHFFCTII